MRFYSHQCNSKQFAGVEGNLGQWNNEVRQLFYDNYGDFPYLLDVKVDKHLF